MLHFWEVPSCKFPSKTVKWSRRSSDLKIIFFKILVKTLYFCQIFRLIFYLTADLQMSTKSEPLQVRESVTTFWNQERKIYNIFNNERERTDHILPQTCGSVFTIGYNPQFLCKKVCCMIIDIQNIFSHNLQSEKETNGVSEYLEMFLDLTTGYKVCR